ncbi:URC4/urg3 family protein [Pinisolibacter aquiterrae]|uniref:URC4/urg3 family protein n=1 Tax=Pinisolibacter aquiterrae TaxID=2815579 RepID=UPI001C3D3876|nr:URC4/urg3 family protein [Pinisolibacter aquiterrae]MBV5266836.1 URC4/urg3 family protein [Pinisolibacter aquiterrae]MCC8234850.1 URC4/urg3 family protein [Pinisolibacter aquiterrae]
MSLDSASATPEDVAAARRLLSAEAVRERANRLFDLALMERLDHFRVDLARLDPVADWVQRLIRSEHPTLEVPPHSRWRNFEVGGIDRWGGLAASREWADALEFGRASIDLAMISVLIDAGAGTRWAYAEAVTGETFTRTEGLAVASLAMFASGIFSSEPFDPLRADARALAGLTAEELADGFQVSQSNPLVGLEGRLGLLNRLGQQLAHRSDVFGTEDGARPGGLLDHLLRRFPDGRVPAPAILATLLDALGPIWPGRWSLAGVPLGDTWIHQKLVTEDATNQLMPIHKLSQWLTYSLIEPLSWAGLEITNLDGLTGLAEYRNGGLLIDGGILVLRDPDAALRSHSVDEELVVEWRALTIAVIDRLAAIIRQGLGRNALNFPLACVLEGGTWLAGRRLARERRPDGSPPLTIVSDGTVF